MASSSPSNAEALQLDLDAGAFKELLRDLLFREAGKPYFKRFAIPRRRRLLGAWKTLSPYQAEHQLLPVGGHGLDQRIRQFFTAHPCLRVEFQEHGMPVTAVHVLRLRCPPRNRALEQIQTLECSLVGSDTMYRVRLTGGPLPPVPADPA